MLDFCLRLFCPSPGRKNRRERYINPTSLAISKPRRRYPVPSPVYPLPAPIFHPPEQIYQQPRLISPVYYPEPESEPEPEFSFSQRFERVPFEPISRREIDPEVQRIHLAEPEPEIYLPLRRPRSPPSQYIHFVQQFPPPYIPSPPPSPATHHIHVLPPPAPRTPSPPHTHIRVLPPPVPLPPAPRTPSPPHTHIHLLAPAPSPHLHGPLHLPLKHSL
ncbi:92540367-b98e-4423-9c55-9a262fe0d2a7 [Sclerotinia trifoliorum]|uniref:92540367-b98e-4423-9c55-9a262fe0d2a7 n=1 Tax=Sclerotinia trifoliorum TaxID=28548 RepID=A0A8H2VL06_9HELO|nr:92540367-b98e-4423-9c55-9a262fe0d2a7 [Sclerotinia trifoliorum]